RTPVVTSGTPFRRKKRWTFSRTSALRAVESVSGGRATSRLTCTAAGPTATTTACLHGNGQASRDQGEREGERVRERGTERSSAASASARDSSGVRDRTLAQVMASPATHTAL